MRRTKIVKIDNREITVKELRAKDIRKLLEEMERLEKTGDPMEKLDELLPLATDLKVRDLEELAPSELKVLWEAFREVNADFLALTGRLGIGKALVNSLQKSLKDSLADLLSAGTPAPGDTVSDSS